MFKVILTLLVGVTLGGILVFFLLKEPDQQPVAETGPAERPAWMAAPEKVAPVAREEPLRALKVGVIGPETGEESRYGLSILSGINMAVERFNAGGGLDGKPIEVVHYDNNAGSGQAQAISEELVKQNVVAIFSAPTGWSTFAPTHVANATDTIFISIGTRRKIGLSGDYVFHFSLPVHLAIDEMLKFAADELGYRNYAMVTSSSHDYSLDISAEFKKLAPKHNGKILIEADTYDTFTGTTNIGDVVKALKNGPKDIQALIFTGGPGEAASLANAVEAAGLDLPIIGGEDLFSDDFIKQGGDAVLDTLLYATFSPERESSLTTGFVEDHKRLENSVPDRFTALAFDAFSLLGEALKSAASMKSSAVRNAMLELKEIEGVTGASHWSAEGTPIKHPFLYQVVDGHYGKTFVLLQEHGK